MIIAGILFFLETFFAVFLYRKSKQLLIQKKLLEEKSQMLIRRGRFLQNQKLILEEDYRKELEEKKNWILDEFRDRLNHYHAIRR
ncbi:MAG: hypothetical protein M1412_01765 [Deltaproteobacteria bacterium]|nr:hypothetical protein [Deltaproteobacteria bacterium]MCL5891882.1 hypothetical protein [Deltaproteobacteria bacterium]